MEDAPAQTEEPKSRAERQRIEVEGGLKTLNEVRRENGLSPVDGGDTLLLGAKLVPLAEVVGSSGVETKRGETYDGDAWLERYPGQPRTSDGRLDFGKIRQVNAPSNEDDSNGSGGGGADASWDASLAAPWGGMKRDAVTQQYFNGLYNVNVAQRAQIDKFSRSAFKRVLEDREWGELIGAPDGSTVQVRPSADGSFVTLLLGGSRVLSNLGFEIHLSPRGGVSHLYMDLVNKSQLLHIQILILFSS